MRRTPAFSVVIDTYNYGRFINEAIDSVLAQKFPENESEILVIDDGSTDDTSERVASYKDRITYIRKENGGQASAFNTGVGLARGKYISFLDADDYFYPSKLEQVLQKFCSDGQIGVVYNRYDVVDEKGKIWFRSLPGKVYEGNIEPRILMGYVSGSPSSGISVRRELLTRIPIPEEPFRISADHFYLNILPLVTHVGVIERSLHAYRVHGDNLYLKRPNLKREEIHSRQRETIWNYAEKATGKQFFRAINDLDYCEKAEYFRNRLTIYTSGARWLFRSHAPLGLRLWTFSKLTVRAAMPRNFYAFIRGCRNLFSNDRLTFG
jgi:glycosyltransferase involved in cell wall biosynthesis